MFFESMPEAHEILIIKIFVGVISGGLALIATILTFLDIYFEDDQSSIKSWIEDKWIWLSIQAIKDLPFKIIALVLDAFEKNKDNHESLKGWSSKSFMVIIPTFLFVYLLHGPDRYMKLSGFIFVIMAPTAIFMQKKSISVIFFAIFSMLFFGGPVLALNEGYDKYLLMIYAILSSVVMAVLRNKKPLFCAKILALVNAGSVTTVLAIIVGLLFSPSTALPDNFQLIFVNAILDAASIYFTVILLRHSFVVGQVRRLLGSVFLIISLCAFFSILALTFGLLNSENYLPLRSVLYVFLGKSTDGSHFTFGSHFWVMHTTFIPILLYLSIVLGAILFSVFNRVAVRALEALGNHKSPLKLSAAFLAVIASFLGLIYFGLNEVEKHKRAEETHQAERALF